MIILYFCVLLWTFVKPEIFDLLSTSNKFLEHFSTNENLDFDLNELKLMVKRTHDLNHKPKVNRRSTNELDNLNQGIYLLNKIEDVTVIPAKFPTDINTLSSQNLLFIFTLEANGNNPENQLANDLVVYQYSSFQGIKQMGKVPVLGGITLAVHSFKNETYFIAAEHDAMSNNSEDSFQGSVLYKMSEKNSKIFLEKIQIFNVIEPNDIKFWEHQDQWFMVIGSNMGSEKFRTGTLVYKWMGQHFDCIQQISTKVVRSLELFTIGSFFYMAIANFQDEYGTTDVESNIYRFYLADMKFHLIQNLKTQGARHIAHFKFENALMKKNENFLAVANNWGKNSTGSLTSYLESVIYKFDGNYFIPFQSFKLRGATKWLPIQGPKEEFLLLVAYSSGIRGYQYDGWRFSQVSLQFGQSLWGTNLQSMRAFQYFGDIFLTISDRNSNGNGVNLWKISFVSKNFFEEEFKELEIWCQSTKAQIENDNFTNIMSSLPSDILEEPFIKAKNLKTELSEEGYLKKEIEKMIEKVVSLDNKLNEVENYVDSWKNYSELPIIFGSKEIPNLEIKCEEENCVEFHNLKVLNLNGENFSKFLANIVSLNSHFTDTVADFKHVKVEKDLSPATVNGHPSGTLFDVTASNFANTDFSVNGTVLINEKLNVNGFFDEIAPTKSDILLNKDNQTFKGKITSDKLKIDNLILYGKLNGIPVKDLMKKPATDLQNTFKELNVNNMFVEGLINGYNISDYFAEALRKYETLKIQGDLIINSLEVDKIVVDSNKILNATNSQKIQLNSCGLQSFTNNSDVETLLPKLKINKNFHQTLNNHRGNNSSDPIDIVIVVENFLESNDIVDYDNVTSLLDTFTHGYELNNSILNLELQFSDFVATDFKPQIINNIPVDSWILRNSNETQYIKGKKKFLNNVFIQNEVIVGSINNLNLEKIKKEFLDFNYNQNLIENFTFAAINCHSINTSFFNFGKELLDNINRLSVEKNVNLEQLHASNLQVLGDINGLYWEEILADSVFEPSDSVFSEKIIKNTVAIHNLNISGQVNGLLIEDFIVLGSKEGSKIVLDKNVELENLLDVNELHFEGVIDNILRPGFEAEWFLQNETQIIRSPFIVKKIYTKSGSVLSNDKVNDVSLKKLFTKSIKINNDAKFKYLFMFDKVNTNTIDVGGYFNGAQFNSSIMRSNGMKTQHVAGEWYFDDGLIVNGSLVVEKFVSSVNFSDLCASNILKNFNLIIKGSVKFRNEPNINLKVNNISISEKMKNVWLANENISLKGKTLKFQKLNFDNKTTLQESLNNKNLTHLSTHYLSKTFPRVVSSNLEFSKLIIQKGCRMRIANVEGTVNGINLTHWTKNILLQQEDQIIDGNLRFEIFKTSDLKLDGTINRINLSKDILRFDSENSVVGEEKTFGSINISNLRTAKTTLLQGVNLEVWKKNFVDVNKNIFMRGDLTLAKTSFRKPINVLGNVNNFYFDSKHLLTRKGDHEITGVKNFNLSNTPNAFIKIKILEISGLVDDVEFNSLLTNQAYSNRRISFSKHQTFTKGFSVNSAEVSGLFQGVNVSNICHEIFNPINTNEAKNKYDELMQKTKTFIKMARDQAYFFDYFELIQTLKPNVNAVVPTMGNEMNHMIAVVTPQTMKFLHWDEYSESFINADLNLKLIDNITFISSEINEENPLLYVETLNSTKIFQSDLVQEIKVKNTSCIASFQLNLTNKKNCIFIGQKWDSSRILCFNQTVQDLRMYQTLKSKGSVQATAVTIHDEVYLAIINKEQVVDKIENTLSIYKFNTEVQNFQLTHTLAEVNPVAVSSIAYKDDYYLVSAGGHLPESMHNSVLSIFRFHKNHKVFIRSQSIHVDTPVDVHFALLPSSQLALYVLTSNPTKPFIVFLNKGMSGFTEETSGLSLYPGSSIYSFTNSKNQHFVVISGFGKGQILRAGFKGDKISM